MVRLRFFNLQPPSSVDVAGPSFLFDANEIRKLPSEETVATHHENQWSVDNRWYLRLEVPHAVECHFRAEGQRSQKLGPFDHFSAVDGVVVGDARPLAMIQKDGWASLIDGRVWPAFVLAPTRGSLSRE